MYWNCEILDVRWPDKRGVPIRIALAGEVEAASDALIDAVVRRRPRPAIPTPARDVMGTKSPFRMESP